MKKILLTVFMFFATTFAETDLDDINFRIGGTFILGFDDLASGSLSEAGFKMEPGLDIDPFRIGLDFELNIGRQFIENRHQFTVECYTSYSYTNQLTSYENCYDRRQSYEEELGVFIADTKFGIVLYLQSENIGALIEPYVIIPLGIDDESAKLEDDLFTSSAQIAFGIRAGIRFYTYNQITIGYEQTAFKLYDENTNRVSITYSLLWQKSEKPTYTTYSQSTSYSSYSSYIPSVSISETDTSSYSSDTTSYYNAYSSDRVYVRGHYRHYKSGKVSYVRPHTRSYPRRR